MTNPNNVQPGDLVEFVGSGWCSALIGGPGRVVSIDEASASVEVLTAAECLGNRFQRGEVLLFGLKSLRPVKEEPQ